MAKGKKSFILYADLIHTVEKMPDEKAGQLFKHILKFINDHNPETDDLIIQIAFEPIKQQLKRDLQSWEEVSAKRSEIGRLGGLKSGETRATKPNQKEPIGSNAKQNEHDTVNDNVNVINKDVYTFDEFWSEYPNKVAKVKCKPKYENLPVKDKIRIKETLKVFIQHKPFSGYNHPNPETYLNQKRWEDVIAGAEVKPALTKEEEIKRKTDAFFNRL